MKKNFLLSLLFIGILLGCSTFAKADSCTGNVPVPNEDWVLLSEVYDKEIEHEKGVTDLVDSRDVPPPKYLDPTTVISTKGYKFYKDKNGVYLLGMKIPGACPNTFEVLSSYWEGGYAKDATQVFVRGEKLQGADAKSFTYLGYARGSFAKDKKAVYLDGKKISYVDRASFVLVDDYFVKDKKHVYINWNGEKPMTIVKNADPKTFESLGHGYAKDPSAVYQYWGKVDGADPKTFQLLNQYGMYTKDKNAVFIDGHKVEGVDSSSFQVLPNEILKDKNHVYCRKEKLIPREDDISSYYLEWILEPVPGADPATYRDLAIHSFRVDSKSVYQGCSKIEGLDAQSFQVLSESGYYSPYLKDKNGIYYISRDGVQPLAADPKTFTIISKSSSEFYAKDKNKVFFSKFDDPQEIEGADPQTFQVFKGDFESSRWYSKDKNYVYYNGKKIPGADSKTFQPLNYFLGKDKKNVYRGLEKISGLDPASVKILGYSNSSNFYVVDKASVYYVEPFNDQVKKLEPVNPKTFRLSTHENNLNLMCASDGKSYYRSGEKVESCPMN